MMEVGLAQTMGVPSDDPAMGAAIAKARQTLPMFWKRLASPEAGDSYFAIKIKYDTRDGKAIEHIWANNVLRTGEMIVATISNEPEDIPELKFGQVVAVEVSRITDWMYENSGRYHGAYTLRALIPKLPKNQADELSARLAPE